MRALSNQFSSPPEGGNLDCVICHNYITNSKCTEALVSMKMLWVYVNFTVCVMCSHPATDLIYSLPASVINISLLCIVELQPARCSPALCAPQWATCPVSWLPACLPGGREGGMEGWVGWGELGGVDCGWGASGRAPGHSEYFIKGLEVGWAHQGLSRAEVK